MTKGPATFALAVECWLLSILPSAFAQSAFPPPDNTDEPVVSCTVTGACPSFPVAAGGVTQQIAGTINVNCGGAGCGPITVPCAVTGLGPSCTILVPSTNGLTGGADGAPPPPPSLAEALGTCPRPGASAIGRDPYGEGVTGLDTWLWAVTPPGASSSSSVRGYPVTCTTSPVGWTWTSGDGSRYQRDTAGGPHPFEAATHLFEARGDFDLGLAVSWLLTTNYGSGTVTLDTVERYHVFEVRSVLTASG
jgi:hypothetical protein